jgi:integrase
MRQTILTSLKTMLTFAQGQGLVAQNVARGHRRSKSEDRHATSGPLREGVDFPSKAELKAMIEKAPDRWRAFIITAIFTGMRISELRGLAWRDVDIDVGIIHVRQRADAWRKLGAPKSKAGARDIPLTPMAINALRQWRQDCPRGTLDLVFPNNRGNIESLQNLRERVFIPLQRTAGIVAETYGFHALRHAAASLFIAHLGWTPKRVQVVMGHANIAMTFVATYSRITTPTAKR